MTEFRSQFRLPQDLADRLKKSAAENHRSLNAEIVDRLESSYVSEKSSSLGTLVIKSATGQVTVQADKAELAKWLSKNTD